MNSKAERPLIHGNLSEVKGIWKSYLIEPSFLTELIITIILLTGILVSFTFFLNFIESRDGINFSDKLLELIHPVELSGLTFLLIYTPILIGIGCLLKNPPRLLFAFQVYILLLAVRIITLYLLPLNPPQSMVLLNDPIVSYLGTGQILTKDLFFSGHTATIFLLYLVVNNKKLKILFLICFIILAAALLVQHVHYTIDVFAAPFFAYTCYRIVLLIGRRYKF